MRVGSRSNDLCPYTREGDTGTQTGKKMEAEIEMTQLQARNAEGLQEAPETGRHKEDPHPTTPNLANTLMSDFWPPEL